MKAPRFLLDVDGVLADFSGGCLDVIENMTGRRHTHEDIDQWCIPDCAAFQLGSASLRCEFWSRVGAPGFCRGLKPTPGAKELVETLSEAGDVYACTSPFDSSTWVREREDWLKVVLGIKPSRIVFAHEKHIVRGSMLVDDKPSHIEDWAAENSGGLSLLVDQPYNRAHSLKAGRRVANLSQVLEVYYGS